MRSLRWLWLVIAAQARDFRPLMISTSNRGSNSRILTDMCTSPITIRYSNIHTYSTRFKSIQVPCGKCCECKKKYQNDWMLRINEEIKSCGYKAVFVTFTYNNEHVPRVWDKETGCCYLSVCKRHPQNAIKRFRTAYKRKFGKDAPLRYFLTSEYGPRTCRPHYHAIFFGLTKEDLLPLLTDWSERYGYVKADNVTGKPQAVAKYVSKYCSKGVFECPYIKQGFVAPTFHLMSKGIGRNFVEVDAVRRYYIWPPERKFKDGDRLHYTDEYLDFIGFRLRMSLDGFDYAFPRYYKTKLYGSGNTLSRQVEDYVFRTNMQLLDDKCAKLQAERCCSYREAFYLVTRSSRDEMERREEEAKSLLERFYNKSKL